MIRNSFIHATQSPGQKHIPRSREAMEYTFNDGLRAQAELADYEAEEIAKSAILETNLATGLLFEIMLDVRDILIEINSSRASGAVSFETPASGLSH